MVAAAPAPNRRSLLIALAVLFCLGSACGTEEKPSNGDPGTDAAMQSDAGSDVSGTSDASDAATTGEFQLGTNPVGEATPEGFTAMEDGAAVPFTFGVQGSWMVVLAFRTHDMIGEMFEVRANITIDGEESGDIWLERQETFPGGDGWDYYYSLFLAIDGEPPPEGTSMQIEMSVTDEDGVTVEKEHDVVAGSADGP